MTTTMRIERVRYTRRNRKAAIRLINGASAWLRTMDTDQWAKPWPSRRARNKRVYRDLKDGKTWFVYEGNTLAAMVTIARMHIPRVWSASTCDLSEPAVYVHRLVTARPYSGLGLGAELIDWAGRRGQLMYQAKWIRIDVWTTNTGLHQYYKMQRFEPCGRCADDTYPSGALFQKSVDDIERHAIPHVAGDSAEFVLLRSRGPAPREESSVAGQCRPSGQVNHLKVRVLSPLGYVPLLGWPGISLVTSPERGRTATKMIKRLFLGQKVERDGSAPITDTRLERGRRKSPEHSLVAPGQATGTKPSRPSKEVSWPSVTAALPRNTGTSTTTPAPELTGIARNGR